MLDLRKLHMLAELHSRGTITAVASALHLTAPGVSMQLAALEREVGLVLTERVGRRVVLTPAGRALATRAGAIIEGVVEAERELTALRDQRSGSFRIAAFPSAARSIVAPVWASAADIRLSLVELEPHESLPRLVAGDLDLALTHSYTNLPVELPEPLVARPLASEPVWLAVRSKALPGETVDLASYSGSDWIVPARDLSCYEMVQRATGAAGFIPKVVAEATDFSVQLALVAAGAGVALIPQLTIVSLPPGVGLLQLRDPVRRNLFTVTRRSLDGDIALAALRSLVEQQAAVAVAASVEA